MSRSLKCLCYGLMAAVWVCVACLGAESWEAWRTTAAEKRYPKECEARQKEAGEMPTDPQALPLPVEPAQCCGAGRFHPIAMPQQDAATLQHDRQVFSAKNDHNRHVIDALENTVEVTIDPSGNATAFFGDPELERLARSFLGKTKTAPIPQELKQLLDDASNLRQPQRCRFESTTSEEKFRYEATLTPPTAGADAASPRCLSIRNVSNEMPFSERWIGPPLTKESVWEMPWYSYKKNADVPNHHYNNYGFRDDDVVVPKPPGLFRILCVGASTTEEGPSGERTYPNMVEQMFKSSFGPGRVDVVNCGVSGLDSGLERQRMPDYLALEPDLIVFYEAINDIQGGMFYFRENATWPRRLGGKSTFIKHHFNDRIRPSDIEAEAFLRNTFLRNLEAMVYAAREKGVPMAFCSFARPEVNLLTREQRDYLDACLRIQWSSGTTNIDTYCHWVDIANGLIREMCKTEGLMYIPVSENIRAGMDYFWDPCHMSTVGSQYKARIIAGYLQACIDLPKS